MFSIFALAPDLAIMTEGFISQRGFSTGIKDYDIPENAVSRIKEISDEATVRINKLLDVLTAVSTSPSRPPILWRKYSRGSRPDLYDDFTKPLALPPISSRRKRPGQRQGS